MSGDKAGTVLLRKLASVVNALPPAVLNRFGEAVLDGMAAALAVWIGFMLRFDFSVPASETKPMLLWIAIMAVARPLNSWLFSGYTAIWRYFNLRDASTLALRALIPSLLAVIVRLGLAHTYRLAAFPLSVIFIEYGTFLALAVCVRSLRRLLHEIGVSENSRILRTIVIGRDESLASALRHVGSYPDLRIVGIVAEEPHLRNCRIGGHSVLGTPDQLPELLVQNGIEAVLLTGSNLSCIGECVSAATEVGAQVRLMPSARDLIEDKVRVSTTPATENLLKKASRADLPHDLVVKCFKGKSVLVTGAGGSIGSEISRQLSKLPVARVILLDQDENSIFEINGEIRGCGREVVPLVGDIRDRDMLDNLFATYRPNVVLHAAAYKHVPVMEFNCAEAVLNNITGTRELVDAATEHGCERFVMISSDKAVRPSSVMGATKRVAELLVQDRSTRHGSIDFACVRFGNVLGSRGSVAPIFLRQIAAGGPITITHEEMTRYFMTIPEAVQLVLQAATLASTGDVYMLDMGDPIKIIDLARRLIELSGLRPGLDIKIDITGIRPGEKLHEQLWSEHAEVTPTIFPFVYRVKATPVPEEFIPQLVALEASAAERKPSNEIAEELATLPIDFQRKVIAAKAAH